MIGKSIANRSFLSIEGHNSINDSSPNAYSVTAAVNAGFGDGINGETNGAFNFTGGANSYLSVINTAQQRMATAINNNGTLMYWLRFDTSTITRQIVGAYSVDAQATWLSQHQQTGDQMFFGTYQGNTTNTGNITTYNLSDNIWYHFVFTFDNYSNNIYRDAGNKVSWTQTGDAKEDSTNPILIGTRSDMVASGSIDGRMQQIRCYEYTLTEGQIKILYNEKGRISLPKKLLLDNYSGSAVAYLLRKLRYNYSGSAIRVRRASDNAEQDIGFVSNELDTSSLASFCSGTNGFVVTWYDQSGNGNNMVQSTTASQPKIYDSSTGVLLENGKPTIQFDGSIDWLDISITKPARFSIYSVMKLDSNTTTFSGFGSGNSLGQNKTMWGMLVFRNTSKVVTSWGNDTNYSDYISNSAITTTSQDLYNVLYDSGLNVYIYKDNSSVALSVESSSSATTSAGTSYKFSIGRLGEYNGFYLDGNVQELVLYTSYQGTNNSAINTNINNYYGIY